MFKFQKFPTRERLSSLYQHSVASVSTDKKTAGDQSKITVELKDQDGNIDPTAIDMFRTNPSFVSALIAGTNHMTTGNALFTEKDNNTGAFDLDVFVNKS